MVIYIHSCYGGCYHGNNCYDYTQVVEKVIVAMVTYMYVMLLFYVDHMVPLIRGLHYNYDDVVNKMLNLLFFSFYYFERQKFPLLLKNHTIKL